MAPSPLCSSRTLRAGLTGVACLALAGLGATSAAAAGDPVVPLTPRTLGLALLPVESLPDDASALTDMSGVADLDPTSFVAVPAAYGGTVEVHLPASLDGSHLVATLDVPAAGARPDPAKDAVATSAGAAPAIRVTPAGTDTYRITLPASADLGTAHGDDGYLELSGITNGLGSAAAAFVVLPYRLGLAAGDASTELDPVLFAAGEVPGASVAAGSSLRVTLPDTSVLQDLGVRDLAGGGFVLQAVGPNGQPTGADPLVLAAAVSADGRSAALTVPAGAPVGTYVLAAVLADTGETTVTITVAQLVVTRAQAVPVVAPVAPPSAAPPAAPSAAPSRAAAPVAAVPVVHRGLRSNTGWGEGTGAAAPAAVSAGVSAGGHPAGHPDPWLAAGGVAAVLVAAAGATAALRTRPRGGARG